MDALPITVGSAHLGTLPTPAPHERTADIIRQVEHYFSDENLRQDAHLLALFQEGKGTVSFNEICGFRKMRKYKPKAAVREALRQSNLVEVSEDGKRLGRKVPLDPRQITVIPKINEDRKKTVVPEDKPWLTKGMMKPTGFETHITNGPINPKEYEEDCRDYDPEYSFTSRIETAITRFCAKRKMHSITRKIFVKFMMLGGMDCGQRQFTGGLDEKSAEDYTKKEIAALTSEYGVAEQIVDALYEAENGGPVTWIVNFELVAKSFLSSEFLNHFDWYDEKLVQTASNILRNFYNYLLLHDVCPEYRDQLLAARVVCDTAEVELPKLREVDQRLPGGFNIAASTLFGGNYSNLHASEGDWVLQGDDLGYSKADADFIFNAGVFAHGTEEQLVKLETVRKEGESFHVVSSEELGLEITGVELADGEAMNIYTSPELTNTVVKPMGKLYCKRWEVPHAAPVDLPQWVLDEQKADEFVFLVDDKTLKFCIPGMKMECCVKELDLGIKWIDYVEVVYPSFYTWLLNERVRDLKQPGSPTAWMQRMMAQRPGQVNDFRVGYDEDEGELEDDDLPD